MTDQELEKIEKRNPRSLDVAALAIEVRTAWRVMDQVVQARVDQERIVESLQARVRELEGSHVS